MYIKNILDNFKKYSFLLKQLVARDFKVKYKRSVLGVWLSWQSCFQMCLSFLFRA